MFKPVLIATALGLLLAADAGCKKKGEETEKPAEVADGVQRLAKGTTRAAFVLRVADSQEHRARVKVESNVQAIWFALLRRSPSASELSGWSSRIRGGTPSATAVAGLLGSAEYLRRFPPA